MIRQPSYDKRDLLANAFGVLADQDPRSRLPAPPFLMFDRIPAIAETGGTYGRGLVVAEKDVVYDEWFFLCHFRGDPVMPGCLGLDALWQLCGFFLAWSGCRGHGRALGCGSVEFSGEIRPDNALVTYELSVRRLVREPQPTIVADGTVAVDGKLIYDCKGLKAGMFDLPYAYPVSRGSDSRGAAHAEHARGAEQARGAGQAEGAEQARGAGRGATGGADGPA
jgi:3-hydroxyacyl-[acyl-carrier protein] dehydratase/trans-2-decenoyl-[acyl-carrier protein] isomerase